jgi:hypothetical protein
MDNVLFDLDPTRREIVVRTYTVTEASDEARLPHRKRTEQADLLLDRNTLLVALMTYQATSPGKTLSPAFPFPAHHHQRGPSVRPDHSELGHSLLIPR